MDNISKKSFTNDEFDKLLDELTAKISPKLLKWIDFSEYPKFGYNMNNAIIESTENHDDVAFILDQDIYHIDVLVDFLRYGNLDKIKLVVSYCSDNNKKINYSDNKILSNILLFGNLEILEWYTKCLIQEKQEYNISKNITYVLGKAFLNGNEKNRNDIVLWLFKYINDNKLTLDLSKVFVLACDSDNIDVINLVINHSKLSIIEIHSDINNLFYDQCIQFHFKTVKWLYNEIKHNNQRIGTDILNNTFSEICKILHYNMNNNSNRLINLLNNVLNIFIFLISVANEENNLIDLTKIEDCEHIIFDNSNVIKNDVFVKIHKLLKVYLEKTNQYEILHYNHHNQKTFILH